MPHFSDMKDWGCNAYVKRTKSDKLKLNSINIYLWDIQETIEYQFYNFVEKNVFISRHVTLLEKVFILEEDSGSRVNLERVQGFTDIVNQVDNLSLIPKC